MVWTLTLSCDARSAVVTTASSQCHDDERAI